MEVKNDFETISIKDVDCEYCYDDFEQKTVCTSELKYFWNEVDKEDWYSTKKKQNKFSAREVLDWIYDQFEYGEFGSEDLSSEMWNDTTDEQLENLQKALDDIFNGNAFTIYLKDKKIID